MDKLHEVLQNQLERLEIDTENLSDLKISKLLMLISNTYKENDDYRYAMERSLDIASEEINEINQAYQTEIEKINTVSNDGIIMVNMDWKIISVNKRAEVLLHLSADDIINQSIDENLIILNTQKQKLALEKLSMHFECGKSYVCNKGVIANCKVPGHEIYASITISPFYTQNTLSSYIFIIRDITEESLKDFEHMLSELKTAGFISNKQMAVLGWCQGMYSDLHNGLFALESLNTNSSDSDKQLQQFILSHSIQNDLSTLNLMYSRCSRDDVQQCFFDIDGLVSQFQATMQAIALRDDIEVINNITYPVLGDAFQFIQLNYEILSRILKKLKSCTFKHVSFSSTKNAIKSVDAVTAVYYFDIAYPIQEFDIHTLMDEVNQTLGISLIDDASILVSETSLEISLVLDYTISSSESSAVSTKSGLRALIFAEEESTLLWQLKRAFLLNVMNYETVDSAEEVVRLMKEARLNKNEYHVIISDLQNFEILENQVLCEISSYVSDNFAGLIYINNHDSYANTSTHIPLHVVQPNPTMKEVRKLIYEMNGRLLYHTQNRLHSNYLAQDVNAYDKVVLYIHNEPYSETMYLNLFDILGMRVMTIKTDYHVSSLEREKFDAVIMNFHDQIPKSIELINVCKDLWPTTPIVAYFPPLLETVLADTLSRGVDFYLFKPFSVSDFLSILKRMFP